MTRLKLVLGSLTGAVAIQLAFFACSSSSTPGAATDDREAGSGGMMGTMMNVVDAMVDAVANVMEGGTRDAKADAVDGGDAGPTFVPVTISKVVQPCNSSYDAGPDNGGTTYYAEVPVVGLSAATIAQRLVNASFIGSVTYGSVASPPQYGSTFLVGGPPSEVWFRDGFVGALCNTASDTVVFYITNE